ncbi:MAG: serine acetyltransferase, partial [Muribaculaceae bacterium]|nr:serine acetyltransferase [Muribaculaceae bacterium]
NLNTFNVCLTIWHDAVIGNFNSLMPAVKISGGVQIGERNFIGVNSVILQYKSIGNETTIGAGAIVIRNAKDGNTYIGNPATKVKY